MTRAKIYHSPGFIWHITHRCHNRDFLLRFNRDRKNWILWLFKAKKKYGMIILNYMVTSNHIHLLIYNDGRRDIVSRSMLLVASRTAVDYNNRKKRSGAFWEDNYHATAVGTDRHFLECLLYIDMNMVRAGVVEHPGEWPMSGYNEIIVRQKKRYRLIDQTTLMKILDISDFSDWQKQYEECIEEKLALRNQKREEKWTEALAVGSKEFIESYQKTIGTKHRHKIYNDGREKESFILK